MRRLRIDLVVEHVARGLQRQDGPAARAGLGEHRHPCPLREPRRPGADRPHRQPAVRLELRDLGAEGVDMADDRAVGAADLAAQVRSEEHTSELQSLMRISYAVFCLKKKTPRKETTIHNKQKKREQDTTK